MDEKKHEEITLGQDEFNIADTRERFDAFDKWSQQAIDAEFKTALWEHINISEIEALDKCLKEIDDPANKVLEAGCGSGRILFHLADKYKDVTGSDFSAGLLEKAKSYSTKQIELVQAEIEDLPFENETFDIVVSVRVIQHLSNEKQQLAIKEMSRILKKGGSLVIVTYNALTLLALYKLVNMSGLYKIWPRWPLRDWKWVIDDYSFPWGLKKMFKRAGLSTEQLIGGVLGEPEVLKFLKISHLLEKYANKPFRLYLKFWRSVDRIFHNVCFIKYFFGRVVIRGEKNG